MDKNIELDEEIVLGDELGRLADLAITTLSTKQMKEVGELWNTLLEKQAGNKRQPDMCEVYRQIISAFHILGIK